MKKTETKKTLQVGESTKETSPVAARMEINSIFGRQLFFFKGEYATSIIDKLQSIQNLYCLCRQAQSMGSKKDANIAERLEKFLDSDYDIEDFDKFDFPFSIGSIRCINWAKGEKNCDLLESMHKEEENKKEA